MTDFQDLSLGLWNQIVCEWEVYRQNLQQTPLWPCHSFMVKNHDSGTILSKGNLENKIVYWGIVF